MFQIEFEDDTAVEVAIDEGDSLETEFSSVEQTEITEYQFGNGLVYDYETNTLSADSTDTIAEGNTQLATSNGVALALAAMGVSYSQEEHIAGVWTDGKVLYERTFVLNNQRIHNVRSYSFAHGISDVDTMIVSEAYLVDDNVSLSFGKPINVIGGVIIGNNAIMMQWVADDTYIWINATSYFNAHEDRTWILKVRYTKTAE